MPDMKNLPALIDTHHKIERLRVATQLRLQSLAKQGREDRATAQVHETLRRLEEFLERHISSVVEAHPVWTEWARYIKGLSPLLLGRVMGRCDIERLTTPGKMKAHAGFTPDSKRVPGKRLNYDPELKTSCWLVGRQLRLAKGKYYEKFLEYKERIERRWREQGVRIVPGGELPLVDGKRRETDTVKSLAHLDALAMHKMIALWLVHLWSVWRELEGLPVRPPYPIEYLGHTAYISPWDMLDRERRR